MLGLKQVVAGARQAIGAIFPRWGGGGWNRYSIVLPGSHYDYETQAGDLWRTPIIAIGIKWLGDRFPRPIFRVSKIGRGGKYTPYGQHPLADLWNHPNDFYGRRTLEKAIGLSLICDGNAYIQKVRNRGGEVVELWWLPHYRVFPTWPQDGSEFIDGYRIRIDGDNWWLPKEDMIHIKDGVDPHNERLGLSAVKSVLREVCTVNEESGYTASLLRNAGVPGMVLVPDDPSGKLRPTREDADEIKTRMKQVFSGEGRGNALVLQGNFRVEKLSFSPEQLALDKLPTHAIARIAAAMGVAPMSMGLPDAGKTYCLPASSRVWTISGSKSIADVLPGDEVWTVAEGCLVQRPVLRSSKTGHEPLVEIRTKNRVLRGTASHPVMVRKAGRQGVGSNEDRRVRWEWKRLGDLTIGDSVVQPKSLPDQYGEILPNVGFFPGEEATPELMQFLGAFVGDGSMVEHYAPEQRGYSRRLVLSMPIDDRTGQHYRALAASLFLKTDNAPVTIAERPRCFQFQSMPAFRLLKRLGFAGKAKTKRVPGWVYGLTEQLRLAFLAGLVDSDGSVGKDGRLAFQLCNRDLVEDIRDLCISVGIQCCNIRYQQFKACVLPHPGKQDAYDSYGFTASSAVQVARIPFADPLYRKRVADNAHRIRSDGLDASKADLDNRLGFYEVRQIRSLPAEDVYDIEVEEGHCFIADGIVVHNSNLGESNRASWGTVQAVQELVAETLRYQLAPDFGLDPTKNTPEYDYSEIQEMQESLDAIWRRVGQGFIDGVITRNEGRDLLGFAQDPDGDIYRPGTGGTAEPLVRENISVAANQPIGEEGITEDIGKPAAGGKPATSGKPAKPGPTQNGKPINRLAAATANGKPKRWHLAFDSLEELEGKIEHFKNPAFDADGGLPSTTIIVAPEAGQDEHEVKTDDPPPEPDQEKPADPWAGY